MLQLEQSALACSLRAQKLAPDPLCAIAFEAAAAALSNCSQFRPYFSGSASAWGTNHGSS